MGFFQVNIKICSYGICRSDSGIAVELSYNYCNSSQNHKEEPPPQPPHQSLSVWSLCPMYTALWCRVLSDILTAGIKVECLSRFQSAIHIRQYLDRQDNQWGSFQENRLQAIFSQTEIYLPTSGTCKQNPFIQNSANSTAWCAGERDTTHWKAVAQAQRCLQMTFKGLRYWSCRLNCVLKRLLWLEVQVQCWSPYVTVSNLGKQQVKRQTSHRCWMKMPDACQHIYWLVNSSSVPEHRFKLETVFLFVCDRLDQPPKPA